MFLKKSNIQAPFAVRPPTMPLWNPAGNISTNIPSGGTASISQDDSESLRAVAALIENEFDSSSGSTNASAPKYVPPVAPTYEPLSDDEI